MNKNVSSSLAAALAVAAFLLGAGGAVAAPSGLVWVSTAQKPLAAGQLHACRALADSRGLQAAATGASTGDTQAFELLRLRSAGLRSALAGMAAAGEGADEAQSSSERVLQSAAALTEHRLVLVQAYQRLGQMDRQSGDLLEALEEAGSLMLKLERPTEVEAMALGQSLMLSQRVGKSAATFFHPDGISPEAVFLLGKDLNSLKELIAGLLDGSSELRLPRAKSERVRQQLQSAAKQLQDMREAARAMLGNLQAMVVVREALAALRIEARALDGRLDALCDGPQAGSRS
jgi:twitching motility protein PilJ